MQSNKNFWIKLKMNTILSNLRKYINENSDIFALICLAVTVLSMILVLRSGYIITSAMFVLVQFSLASIILHVDYYCSWGDYENHISYQNGSKWDRW